jgi:hypothetical protein
MNTPYADETGGTGLQLLVPARAEGDDPEPARASLAMPASRIAGSARDPSAPTGRADEIESHTRRKPALERLEQSLGGAMTERLLCALAGDHRMRARDLPRDDSSP